MHCPVCESSPEMVFGQFEESIKIGETAFVGIVPSYVCPKCKKQHYTSAPDMKRFELAVASYLAYVGKPVGEMVAFIHRVLGYTSSEMAKLLDISPEHLSRMEHGKRDIDHRIWILLGALAIDAYNGKEDTLIRLKKLMLDQPAPATVRVE